MRSLFFKTLFRTKKGYAPIKILGLVCGLVIFISVLLYINYETSYDNWNKQLKSVYRVSVNYRDNGSSITTPAPLAKFLNTQNVNTTTAVRIQIGARGESETLLSANNKDYYEKNVIKADTSFFEIFPYKFFLGNKKNALSEPNSIVITQQLQKKLFGSENPIGKIIQINKDKQYIVTGVVITDKYPSHLEFNAVIPLKISNENNENWSYPAAFYTYVLLNRLPKDAGLNFSKSINKRLKVLHPVSTDQSFEISLMPVSKIHLFYTDPHSGQNNFSFVIISFLLAIFVLIISCINYVNLTVSTATIRHKEIFVRTFLGAKRRSLFLKFLSESFIHILTSIIIAFIIVIATIPWLNELLQVNLHFWSKTNLLQIIWEVIIILIVLTLLAGIYPAFIFSRFSISRLLKFSQLQKFKKISIRKILLIIQFGVSAFFIISSLIIYTQLKYLTSFNIGYTPGQVIKIQTSGKIYFEYDLFKNKLLALPEIKYVSRGSNIPSDNLSVTALPFNINGSTVNLNVISIDLDFFKTLGVNIAEGRNFLKDYKTDTSSAVIINTSAVHALHLKNPIGQTFTSTCYSDSNNQIKTVVGVINDYNNEGFENKVRPTIYLYNSGCTNSMNFIIAKVQAKNIQNTIKKIEQIWKNIDNKYPMKYSFLDEDFAALLAQYTRMQKIFLVSTVSLLLISLMGIFSISTFELNQRLKELSIRKVLGASYYHLFAIVNNKLISVLLLADVIALPFAYYFTSKWLNKFAYRIAMPWYLYALTIFITLIFTLFIANIRLFKTLNFNPANKLRSE